MQKDEALRQAAYLGEVLEVKILASKGGKAVNARNEYNVGRTVRRSI